MGLDLGSVVARFRRDRQGAIAITFALSLVPLMAFTTAAVEYGRMTAQRNRIQVAADQVSLALAPTAFGKSETEILAEANRMLKSLKPDTPFTAVKSPTEPVISVGGTEITLLVQGRFTPIFNFLQFSANPLSAISTAAIANTTYEIALVIDNSGSMGSSAGGDTKMRSAQTAANRLIDTMMASQRSASRTKFSIVPFTLGVKIGSAYRNESWMDRTGASSAHYDNFERVTLNGYKPTRFDLLDAAGGWSGCVETRPGDWAVNDGAPTSGTPDSLFVPWTAPDEPGNAGAPTYYPNSTTTWTYLNSYINDNGNFCTTTPPTAAQYEQAQKRFCKYYSSNNPMNLSGGRGPNHNCKGQALTRLTSDTTALHNSINAMVADGNTNLLEGFTWGWRTISPNLPFANGRAYNADNNRKIVILLTDGMNVWSDAPNHNKSIYSPMGYYHNARLGTPAPTTTAQARTQMDAKTLQACNNAKAAPNNVVIYTVGFSVSSDPIDSAGLALLRNCATSPAMAYVANDSEAIIQVFVEIQRAITGLRLAR